MNQKEIKELIELLVEKDITEFELERGDMKLHVKRGAVAAPIVQMAPAVSSDIASHRRAGSLDATLLRFSLRPRRRMPLRRYRRPPRPLRPRMPTCLS